MAISSASTREATLSGVTEAGNQAIHRTPADEAENRRALGDLYDRLAHTMCAVVGSAHVVEELTALRISLTAAAPALRVLSPRVLDTIQEGLAQPDPRVLMTSLITGRRLLCRALAPQHWGRQPTAAEQLLWAR
ncbi:hypothetical protein ABZ639_29075 [Saccharomonospora sp. NPDC006951]